MIKVGDIVLFRFYNTPDRKFYGSFHTAKVTSIVEDKFGEKFYNTQRFLAGRVWGATTLKHKEIKKIFKVKMTLQELFNLSEVVTFNNLSTNNLTNIRHRLVEFIGTKHEELAKTVDTKVEQILYNRGELY